MTNKKKEVTQTEETAQALACPTCSSPSPSTRKCIGKVTPQERDEIKGMFERKNALLELSKTLSFDGTENPLYEKLLKDLGPISTQFSTWWGQKGKKYQWESTVSGRWEIDFDTCEIFLIQK